MGSYIVPRNVKGETRVLIFFTTKSFIFTLIGLGIGAFLYAILSAIGAWRVGIGVLIVVAAISFAVGAGKIPDVKTFDFTKKTGGESVDDIILRYIKYLRNKKIYIYSIERSKKNGS